MKGKEKELMIEEGTRVGIVFLNSAYGMYKIGYFY